MAPKAKTESKPLTQDQIAVITKRVISEYNKKVVEQNEKLLNSSEVTKAMVADEKMIKAMNEKIYKSLLAAYEAESKYIELYKETNLAVNGSTSGRYRNINKPEEGTQYFSRYNEDAEEKTKRYVIAANVLKLPIRQQVILGNNGTNFKSVVIPGIGCVYEEIIFQTLDNKTDALQLIQDLLKKATI